MTSKAEKYTINNYDDFIRECAKHSCIKSVIKNSFFVIVEYVNGWSRFPINRFDKFDDVINHAKNYKY